MTAESIRETVVRYRFFLNDMKRLYESLGREEGDWMTGVGMGSKEERVLRRIESHQRRLELVDEAMEHSDLTEIEWATVFWAMEGMSLRKIGERILSLSHRQVQRLLDSAISKMVYFVENGHVR